MRNLAHAIAAKTRGRARRFKDKKKHASKRAARGKAWRR